MSTGLRTAEEKRKPERYSSFVMDHRKKSPPSKDEHDVRYEFKGDSVCQVKFATDRIHWWVSTLQVIYPSCESKDLNNGNGTQIKIKDGDYNGTVIDLMVDPDLILVKGTDPLKWADDEYPKIRDANPRIPPDLDSQEDYKDCLSDSVLIEDSQESLVSQSISVQCQDNISSHCTCSSKAHPHCTCPNASMNDSITHVKQHYKSEQKQSGKEKEKCVEVKPIETKSTPDTSEPPKPLKPSLSNANIIKSDLSVRPKVNDKSDTSDNVDQYGVTDNATANMDTEQTSTSNIEDKMDTIDKIYNEVSDIQLNINAVDKNAAERDEKLTNVIHIMKQDIISDLLKGIKDTCLQPMKEDTLKEIKLFMTNDFKPNIPDAMSPYEKRITDLCLDKARLESRIKSMDKECDEIRINCTSQMKQLETRYEMEINYIKETHEKELKHCRELCNAKVHGIENELARLEGENNDLKANIDYLKKRTTTAGSHIGSEASAFPQRKEIAIKFTENQNPVLSAFYVMDPPLQYKDDTYITAEGAYHVSKVMHDECPLDNDERVRIKKLILGAKTGKEAKDIAEAEIPYNKSWSDVKFGAMACIQKEKKRQCAEFNAELANSKGCIITHPVNDPEWREEFPRILEAVRDNVPYKQKVDSKKTKLNPKSTKNNSESEILLIADSLGLPINPDEFSSHPVQKVQCSGPRALEKHVINMPPSSPNIEVSLVHCGINALRDGTPGEVVAADICKSLDILQKKVPNSKLVYSQMLARPSSNEFAEMTKANDLIQAHCKSKHIVYLVHKDLNESPNLFRDDWHPDEKKGGYRKFCFVLKSVLPETEEKRNQRRNFYRNRGRSRNKNRQGGGQGGSYSRGGSRSRDGSQGGR